MKLAEFEESWVLGSFSNQSHSDMNNCTTGCTGIKYDEADSVAGGDRSIVDDLTRFYLELVILVIINAFISLFGTVSNIINIVVYAKMGLGDVVNVSLLALALSDLLSVFLVVWLCICNSLVYLDPPGIPFDPMTFMYVTAGWPHFIFSRVTCYITAMVSMERCLCVTAPFKVREIITPKRIKCAVAFIFIVFPAAYIPVLSVHTLAWKWDPNHNETRIMADFAEDRERVQAISYYVNDLFFPTLSLVVVTLCAAITIWSLRRNAEWKKGQNIGVTGNAHNKDGNSESKKKVGVANKEMKIVRMLVVISVMFIVCYSPSIILLYVRIVYPELGMYRTYHNLFMCIYSFVFLLEISNSSFNIFIYYVMSSNFKAAFHSLFSWKVDESSVEQKTKL